MTGSAVCGLGGHSQVLQVVFHDRSLCIEKLLVTEKMVTNGRWSLTTGGH
jgi:hypothetical protein